MNSFCGDRARGRHLYDTVWLSPVTTVFADTSGLPEPDRDSRRGRIVGMTPRGQNQVIEAEVPLATMFGYATDVRSKTQGRATYTMQFESYQPVPSSVQEEIVAKVRGH